MITTKQRNELKTYLKRGYVPLVLKELEKQNVLNTKGIPHSESIIRNVLAGRQSNVDIEDALLAVYTKKKQAFEKREKLKNKLLSA